MDAVLMKRGRSGSSLIHVWKQYEIKTTTTYKWNKWSVDTQTRYQWKKYTVKSLKQFRGLVAVVSPSYALWAADSYTEDTEKGYFILNNPTLITAAAGAPYKWMCMGNFKSDIAYTPPGADMFGGKQGRSIQYINGFTANSSTVYTPTVDSTRDAYNYMYEAGDLIGTVTSTSQTRYGTGIQSYSDWNYYIPDGSVEVDIKGSTSYGEVTSTSSSTYPSNGAQGGYWYVSAGSETIQSQGSFKQNVYSTNPNLYPQNGISNGFWYVYSGVLS